MTEASSTRPPRRIYDKGERREKHVGHSPEPEIVFDSHDPKHWVGKCPNDIDDAERDELLNRALIAPKGDREGASVDPLYALRHGVVYVARTSDHGRSWHAYPYKGKLRASVIRALAAWADADGTRRAFDAWVKTYIEKHGA